MPEMIEGPLVLQIGDPIPGKDVKEGLSIGRIIDPPIGHLLEDRQGNLHSYWYHWKREGTRYTKVLVHHGGPSGFDDIGRALAQHSRVISGYMGVETELAGSSEEDRLLKPPFTLRTYAQALRIGIDRIEIPGERAWVNDCLYLVDRTIRGAGIKMPAAELQGRLLSLSQLQPKFDRAKNPYMHQASIDLVKAVQAAQNENRDEAMAALLSMGKDMTERAAEISDILAATIRRYAFLEHLRNSMEDIVKGLKRDVVGAKEKWDQTEDADERRKIILRLTAPLGVGRLSELTTQPFRRRAQRRSLVRLGKIVEYGAHEDWEQRIGRVLTTASIEVIHWHKQIRERVEGEYQLRFPFAST